MQTKWQTSYLDTDVKCLNCIKCIYLFNDGLPLATLKVPQERQTFTGAHDAEVVLC